MAFNSMFSLIFIIFIGLFIYAVVSNIAQWSKNNNSPVLTVPTVIVEKRKKRHHHRNGNHTHTSTSYYISFRVDSGDVMELKVKRSDYHQMDEGMRGDVTFQGTRYLGFVENVS